MASRAVTNRLLGDRAGYGAVIVSIMVAYAISSTVEGATAHGLVLVVQLVTVWLTFTVSGSPHARRITGWAILACVLAAVVLGASNLEDVRLTIALQVLNVLLYLLAPFVIVRDLMRRNVVDTQTLYGSIAAFLLIGMMYAFVYAIVANVQTTPFFSEDAPVSISDLLYFSFVTLTTTGYGDLVPAGEPGRTLAVSETLIGQFFLVIAVAKVVSAWTRHPKDPQDGGAQ
jgi:hypothetical protein